MILDKPNFYILGAAKSGTTSLWYYLNQHPEIFMLNPKEPNFMAFENEKLPPFVGPCSEHYLLNKIYNNTVVNLEDYKKLFRGAEKQSICGEASVRYLYFENALRNIKKYTPNAKCLIILRNPVDRLYSHYCMMRRYTLEPLSLFDALKEEDNRKKMNWGWDWHYTSVSMYGNQIQSYFDVFDKAQFKIIFYENFKENIEFYLKEIYKFLGVNSDFKSKVGKNKNEGFVPRNYTLQYWLNQEKNKDFLKKLLPQKIYFKSVQLIEKANKKPVPILEDVSKKMILDNLKDDITKLETLLEKKTGWI